MKNLLTAILILLAFSSCSNLNTEKYNFAINGTIEGDFKDYIFLLKREAGEWIKLDSHLVQNNSFMLKGNIGLPEMYYLRPENEKIIASVFTEQSDIEFHAKIEDFSNPEISGSATQIEYESFLENDNLFNAQLNTAWQNLKTARKEGDKEAEIKWEKEYDKIETTQKLSFLENAKSNNNSVVSAYIVFKNKYLYDETDLEPVVSGFDPAIKESVYVEGLIRQVETLKRVAVGKPAIDFTMNNLEGNPITLSSLYGEYLLVDFWASWCGPCRQENPNVVAVYNDFKETGFNVLGVSFDKDKNKWAMAVEEDKLNWLQVSDLKGWNNEAGKLYAIGSIPSNVLLNPEGIIIAKNLRGEELRAKLEELLQN